MINDTANPITTNTTPPIKSGMQQYSGIFFFRKRWKLSKVVVSPVMKVTSIINTSKWFALSILPPMGLQPKVGQEPKR